MYTQVEYEELVKETLSRIGKDLGVQFDKPPASDVLSYPRGKWLYETDGPSVMEVQKSTGRGIAKSEAQF